MMEIGLFVAGAVAGYLFAMWSAKSAIAKAMQSDVITFNGRAYRVTPLSTKRGEK